MQALSVDAALWPGAGAPRLGGVVHSVFQRVVNVTGGDGQLFTIAARNIDNAPRTLVADAPGFDGLGLVRGGKVDAAADAITLQGRVRIRLEGARPWHAALPRYPDDDARLRGNVGYAREHAGSGAFGAASRADEPGPTALMPQLIARRTAMLRAALVRGDADAAQRHGQALLGLGPGLTPSGDDYLVGLFAVVHMPGSPCAAWVPVCAAIAAPASERTHAISVAALRAAAAGRVRESLSSFLLALVAGGHADVLPALSRVLAIGSSSGADMVEGMLDGLDVARTLREVNARPVALGV